MNSSRHTFTADFTAHRAVRNGYDVLRDRWLNQTGEVFPLPGFDPAGRGDFRVRVRAAKVHDTVIAGVHSRALAGHAHAPEEFGERVVLLVVNHGMWRFPQAAEHRTATVRAGHFLLRHHTSPSQMNAAPGTRATMLVLPAAPLRPLIGDRPLTGPASSAGVRILLAHAREVAELADDLGPDSQRAARDAVLELVKGVLRTEVDDTEPQLVPALVAAAKEIVRHRLADPDLSPTLLAQELNVSVRTLHRAFASTDESVSASIRRMRLEGSRRQLADPGRRQSITELAAQWQFADSSHFIRAFRKEYGETPAQFAAKTAAEGLD